MQQEYIEIHGARENNLKNVTLRIPKRKITIFTGVSGSGKSSIVFDTIATEAQRQLNETFSMFIRNFLPKYSQPDADSIENLSMAIVVDQKRMGGGSRSTMGTITDIYTLLRILYSRVGEPNIGYSNSFSFNDPQGMCPECNGVGRKIEVDLDALLDTSKSLNEGAMLPAVFAVGTWYWDIYAWSGLFDINKKISDYSEEELELFLHGKTRKIKVTTPTGTMNITFEGLLEKFDRLYIKRDTSTMGAGTQKILDQYTHSAICSLCKGARLSQAALSCKINGRNIAELAHLEIDELIEAIKAIKDPVATTMVASLVERLQHVTDIGLGYLSLDRETDTLSGGESQRIKMVKHLGSSLMDVIYVFDEPSVGLHPRDVHRLNELLQKLRDKGNTVIVVEHDPDVIKVADHIVDVGPLAGARGGEIVFEGSYVDLLESDTLTGRYMKQHLPVKTDVRQATGLMNIEHATLNNLKDVSVTIPKGVLTVATGVAGSGKSSLINQVFLDRYPEAIVISQAAIGASSRSTPATYTGIMDEIRKLFASANNVSASLFSFNSKGACPNCQGAGVIYTDLAGMDGIKTPCEICNGKRFKDEVLEYKLHGKSISEVLELTVEQAADFFGKKEIVKRLEAMNDVGVGYLTLGQPLNTLSGGECQRIKLASELHKKGSIYVMDEPTTGLHMSDITHLLAIINRLVDSGNSVIVIEHNLDIIRNADWIIDLGPEGGSKGGEVIFEGTPEELLKFKDSLTSQFLNN